MAPIAERAVVDLSPAPDDRECDGLELETIGEGNSEEEEKLSELWKGMCTATVS